MKTSLNIVRFLTGLTLLLGLLLAVPGQAGDASAFFLLSDASYGSNERALVRLEGQQLSAIADYGGVDIYVYRVRQPLEFLKAQKNLHRIDTAGVFTGPGLANALTRIWDNWWVGSRRVWRGLFSAEARQAVTAQAPEVRAHPLLHAGSAQALNPQYQPLKGQTLVDRFRYPVHLARPIQPPKDVKLAGSSSDFAQAPAGNVLIPLGQREPGLYLVEAMVGEQRAATLVFVSDSIAVTKVSGKQMLVWVADRRSGQPVASARTVWSDGVGVLASGSTDRRGIVTFSRSAPEKTVVYGEDPQGGIYVAENYYYDSEIYNTKLYAVTDRPLYHPGETVFVKFLGRTFRSARESSPVAAGPLALQVFDASGFQIAGQTLQITPQGGDTQFALPDNAPAGGYELRFGYKGNAYAAAFRVAQYQKPHFEINVLPDQRDVKTGQEISGRLQLRYPDGKPVVNARAELTLRAQRLSMVEGDLGYAGALALKLTSATLSTDSNGSASFVLPAATEPSRYVLTVLATDGAAYRVRVTHEILIERGAASYAVKAAHAFSAAGDSVPFRFELRPGSTSKVSAAVRWDWLRLEDQQRDSGQLSGSDPFNLHFAKGGTYTVSLRDAAGNVVGATTHYVSGAGIGAPQGSIQMVSDKSSYQAGATASVLITFPEKVDQALFSLERDRVEKTALMAAATSWVRAQRLSDTQWRAELSVLADYGPNITFSVVYVKGGDFVFQNLGLKVEQPRIAVAVQADKAVYRPGEQVTLELTAHIGGKAALDSQLTLSVVDEMVYVLQPEIAPDIFDFFYHPRRNNVRTTASLNFIGYDLAKPPSGQALPTRSQTPQRVLKVLERPRREDKDTALWLPSVKVDGRGRARVSFTMPDSLTRWRVTVRAAAATGMVGQSVAHLLSDKPLYLKWTSPDWLRAQDAPNASVAIFNRSQQPVGVELKASGAGLQRRERLSLQPGANFVALPLKLGSDRLLAANDHQVELALLQDGVSVDALSIPLKVVPLHWPSQHSQSMALTDQHTALKLPADATDLRLQLSDGASAEFRRLMDDLIDYPYGCVEQTASRLIPYSLALLSLLPGEERLAAQLTQRLHSYRLRLAQMAGPKATFGWWSAPTQDGDAFMTSYAYYADWHASRALKLTLPGGHFDRLLEVYRSSGVKRSPWQRALMLYWMHEMGLPVRSLAEALSEESASLASKSAAPAAAKAKPIPVGSSLVMSDDASPWPSLHSAMSQLLSAYVVQQSAGTPTPQASAAALLAAQQLAASELPLAQALLLLSGKRPAAQAAAVLEQVRAEAPTIDRSLTLLWSYRALNAGRSSADPLLRRASASVALPSPWQARPSATGQNVWHWPAASALPAALRLTSAPPPGLTAVARFDSREAEVGTLPVTLQRRIYRLVRQGHSADGAAGTTANGAAPAAAGLVASDANAFTLELLGANAVLQTDQVYLDELTLKHNAKTPLRFGLLEVALPPGTSADRSTWGIEVQLPGSKAAEPLEQARYEQTARGYAVPVDLLEGTRVFRHLLRPAQSGTFVLPPARYVRMYQPEQKAFEEHARARFEIR